MASKFVRGSVRFPALIVAIALLSGVLICVGAVVAAQTAEAGEGSTVKVVEAKVTVTARVQCKKYEKKVLFCTVDAADAVAKNLEMRLLLGFTAWRSTAISTTSIRFPVPRSNSFRRARGLGPTFPGRRRSG